MKLSSGTKLTKEKLVLGNEFHQDYVGLQMVFLSPIMAKYFFYDVTKFSSKTSGQVGYFFQLRKCFSHEQNLVFTVTNLRAKLLSNTYIYIFENSVPKNLEWKGKRGYQIQLGRKVFLPSSKIMS